MTAPHPEAALSAREAAKALKPFADSARSLSEFPPAGLVDGNLYVACKNEGEGTGWRYMAIHALVSDLHRARAALSTARTATAGDGGENAEDQIDLATLTLALDAWGERWFENEADNLLAVCRSFAAQAPAVQAPAGEDWQDISTYPKDSFPRLVWREDYGTCVAFVDVTGQWWPVPAFEELPTPPKLWQPLPASPWATTPTDAQPKAARPMGDEALREALDTIDVHEEAGEYELRVDGDYKPSDFEQQLLEDFGLGLIAKVEEVLRNFLASHPTTGQETVATHTIALPKPTKDQQEYLSNLQMSVSSYDPNTVIRGHDPETVATPRDGGVKEARVMRTLAKLTSAVDAIGTAPSEAEMNELCTALYEHRAALSAPGSAGPEGMKDEGDTALFQKWSHSFLLPGHKYYRPDTALAATPSPAQEPGTGDRGGAELRREVAFFVSCVKALMRHTNPTNVNEGHAQQWFAVSDAIRMKIEPLLGATPATAAETVKGDRA